MNMVKKYMIILLSLMLLISGCGQAYDQETEEVAPKRNTGDRLGVNDDQLDINNDRFGTLGQSERPQPNQEEQQLAQFVTVFSGQDRLRDTREEVYKNV
jgi:hypothetical protein